MLLAPFLVQPHPAAAALHEVVADFHLQHGVDAGKGVDHGPDQGEIAQADKGRFLYRSVFALCCADRLDALEQLAGFLGRQHGRLAFSDDVFGAAHGVGGVHL